MEKIQAYKTTDGTLFDNAIQAERHEMFLQKNMVVEDFLDSELNQYKAMTSRSIARTTIINWELWKVKNAIE